MAGTPETSADYISHHLTNLTFGQFPQGHEQAGQWGFAHNAQEAADFGFWAINVDSMFFSIALGALFLWGFRRAAKAATADVPSGWQNYFATAWCRRGSGGILLLFYYWYRSVRATLLPMLAAFLSVKKRHFR